MCPFRCGTHLAGFCLKTARSLAGTEVEGRLIPHATRAAPVITRSNIPTFHCSKFRHVELHLSSALLAFRLLTGSVLSCGMLGLTVSVHPRSIRCRGDSHFTGIYIQRKRKHPRSLLQRVTVRRRLLIFPIKFNMESASPHFPGSLCYL